MPDNTDENETNEPPAAATDNVQTQARSLGIIECRLEVALESLELRLTLADVRRKLAAIHAISVR